jgi:hypothetical protein
MSEANERRGKSKLLVGAARENKEKSCRKDQCR